MTNTHDIPHGGDLGAIIQAYPNAPTPLIDLSTGISPWPYPCDAIPLDLTALPSHADEQACRESMARYLGCAPDTVTLMPGSQIGISLLPRVLPRSRIVIAGPTYEEHAHAWHSGGHDVTTLPLLDAITAQADVLVLVNPNNPDGTLVAPAELERLRQRQAAKGGWLIIDEAFGDISPSASFASHAGADGLIILRSFGKFFGLAGVRLGALLSPHPLGRLIEQAIGPWAVSTQALRIGAMAYQDTVWINRIRDQHKSRMHELETLLRYAGLNLVGGTNLFCLAQHAHAHALFTHLARAGLYVRRFEKHPTWLRFGLPADMTSLARLKQALSTFGDIE